MVFQSYALYPHKTVYDNLAFGLKIAKVPKDEIDRRVQAASQILQITDYLQRLPKALSGGQRQRVAIGRAIVRDPKVFLFDEPLSNLDAALRTRMRVELKTLHRRLGATMIYVTHDQVEAMTLADKIVVVNKGPRRAGRASTRSLQQAGESLCRRIYRFAADEFHHRRVRAPARRHDRWRPSGASVRRCEDGEIKGVLRHSEKLGNETFAYVNAGDVGDITVRVDGTLVLEPGEAISLGFEPAHLYRFDDAGKSI